MGRMKNLALDLSEMSYGALRAMLDMGGGLTPYVREELDRRHADEKSHTRLADKREDQRPDGSRNRRAGLRCAAIVPARGPTRPARHM